MKTKKIKALWVKADRKQAKKAVITVTAYQKKIEKIVKKYKLYTNKHYQHIKSGTIYATKLKIVSKNMIFMVWS